MNHKKNDPLVGNCVTLRINKKLACWQAFCLFESDLFIEICNLAGALAGQAEKIFRGERVIDQIVWCGRLGAFFDFEIQNGLFGQLLQATDGFFPVDRSIVG